MQTFNSTFKEYGILTILFFYLTLSYIFVKFNNKIYVYDILLNEEKAMKRAIALLALLLLLPLVVTAQTLTFEIEWDDAVNPDSTIAGYLVYRSTDYDTGYVVISDTLTVKDFTISINVDDQYYYYVTAVCIRSRESEPSNKIDLLRPASPTGVRVKRIY